MMMKQKRMQEIITPHTRDGITVPVKHKLPMPAMPRDWDRAALRAVTAIVLVLTVGVVTWSTWTIGQLLGGGVGYVVAPIFDAAWAVCLLLEWMSRFDPAKRKFPRLLGWGLLVLTMGALFWHGAIHHSWSMAVVGAAVSLVGKALWWGVQTHIDRELSEEDQQWVTAQISEANAQMAVASVRRQAARVRHQAAAEILAMEAMYGPAPSHTVSPVASAPSQTDVAPSHIPAQAAPSDVASATSAPALPVASVPAGVDLAAILAALTAATSQPQPSNVAPQQDADADADAEIVDDEDDDAGEPLEPPTLASLSKADAVRIAMRKRPGYTGQQIAELLAGYGVDVTDSYVRQVRIRDQRRAADGDAEILELHPAAE